VPFSCAFYRLDANRLCQFVGLVSFRLIAQGKEDKIAVIVGTITDDPRLFGQFVNVPVCLPRARLIRCFLAYLALIS